MFDCCSFFYQNLDSLLDLEDGGSLVFLKKGSFSFMTIKVFTKLSKNIGSQNVFIVALVGCMASLAMLGHGLVVVFLRFLVKKL